MPVSTFSVLTKIYQHENFKKIFAPIIAEKILENFPHPTMQLIVGKPNYESLLEVYLKSNENATSVHYNRGNVYTLTS